MARLNPLSLRVPDVITETRTFVDPLQTYTDPAITDEKGVPIPQFHNLTLTMRADASWQAQQAAARKGEEYVKQWVKPEPLEEGAEPPPPVALSIPELGRRVLLTEDDCGIIAGLETMQVVAEGEESYTLIDWYAFSVVMPSAFSEILGWTSTLLQRAAGLLKNVSTAATEIPSGPSSTIDTPTPSS